VRESQKVMGEGGRVWAGFRARVIHTPSLRTARYGEQEKRRGMSTLSLARHINCPSATPHHHQAYAVSNDAQFPMARRSLARQVSLSRYLGISSWVVHSTTT
jgi:hypothetical protein